MRPGRIALALVFCLGTLLLPAAPARAGAPAITLAADAPATVAVSGHMEVLRDPPGTMSLDDVLADPGRFRPLARDYNGGQTDDVSWLHFVVSIPAGAPERWSLVMSPPYMGSLTVWQIPRGSVVRPGPQRTGTQVAIEERPYRLALTVVPVTIAPGETADIYVRLASASASLLRAEFLRPHALQARSSWMAVFVGLIAGVLGFAFIGGAVHWLWLRDPSYFWYCAFLANVGVLHLYLTGGLAMLLGNAAPLLSATLGLSGVPGSIACFFLFFHTALDIRGNFPKIYRLQRIVIVLAVICLLVMQVSGYHAVANLLDISVLLTAWTAIYAALTLARRGNQTAFLFGAAFLAAAVGVTVTTTRSLGLWPPTFFTEYAYTIGNVVQVLLLSVGLAARLKLADQAKLLAEEASRLASEQAETHARRLVAERTGELVRAKNELEMALAQERDAIRQQAQFIDMISHEYRTPLAILSSNLDTLMLQPVHEEDKATAERMKRALRRLVDIFETGLRQIGADTPATQPRLEVLRLPALLADLVRQALDSQPGRTIEARLELPQDEPMRGDAALLKVALANLLANACKYSTPDKPVLLHAYEEDATIVISVSDKGIGIPARELPHVSEKYFRASNSRTVPGTGLGLTIVDRVARLHEGHLHLDSVEGEGTTARLFLPRHKPGYSPRPIATTS
ncbi:7TM diverse intracellular signaling domain-containing protein [Radicibacter daui]|uniref:7TM diverse intracellular signaling domain-containing protein n=1 Tax=Radicibacter daui TaxID=3064829 RepID=UPI004046CD2C